MCGESAKSTVNCETVVVNEWAKVSVSTLPILRQMSISWAHNLSLPRAWRSDLGRVKMEESHLRELRRSLVSTILSLCIRGQTSFSDIQLSELVAQEPEMSGKERRGKASG